MKASAAGLPMLQESRWRSLRPLIAPGALFALFVLCGLFAPLLAPYDPSAQDPANRLIAPSWAHLAGTDDFGRDILSRTIHGARVSLLVGVTSVMVSSFVGTALGMTMGYIGGWTEEIGLRLMDIIIAFPGIVLAIALIAAIGSGLASVVFVIALVQVPVFARLARASVLSQLNREYVVAARVIGASHLRVLLGHLLPNALAPTITMIGLSLADAILIEASLSFIGLGVVPPTPTWGNILAAGRNYILLGSWWFTVVPGVAIFLTVLVVNVLADRIRDLLDPRQVLVEA